MQGPLKPPGRKALEVRGTVRGHSVQSCQEDTISEGVGGAGSQDSE